MAAQVNSNTNRVFIPQSYCKTLLSDINSSVLIYLPRGVTKVTDHRVMTVNLLCNTNFTLAKGQRTL